MSVLATSARRMSDKSPVEVDLAEETAIAISYDGSTQAVLMGSPADLEDFAYGFSLTEGIATPDEIEAVTPERVEQGIDLRIWLARDAGQRFIGRRRRTVGPVVMLAPHAPGPARSHHRVAPWLARPPGRSSRGW